MSKYSAYEGQHYGCRCCGPDEVKCKTSNIVSTTGRPIGEAESGETFKVPDSTITNSDNTYKYVLPATVDYELPDIPNIDSDGSVVMTPAQTPFKCSPGIPVTDIKNTAGTLIGQTNPGNDFIVPDTDYVVNLDGVLSATGTFVTYEDETLNIIL